MQIKMREPVTARNIYINPETNTVHLLVPIIGGIEIATDNTCKSVTALKAFFGKYSSQQKNIHSALNTLQNYRTALRKDIILLSDSNSQKALKQSRLEQVSTYIDTLKNVKDDSQLDSLYGLDNSSYPEPIKRIIKNSHNLFSMVLRPADGYDTHLNSVNPIFSVNRVHNTVFFNALLNEFAELNIMPRRSIADMLTQKHGEIRVRNESDFQNLQTKLGTLLGADFFITNEGEQVTKQFINQQMGNDRMTVDEYIETLIHYCTNNLLQTLESSPFRNITSNDCDKLCLLTQFYLGEINIFCKFHDISDQDFGRIIDSNPEIAEALAREVKLAVENNYSAEAVIINFLNTHQEDFRLRSQLTPDQVTDITSRTHRHFAVVEKMANADEFLLTYPEVRGKFISHQGSICTDFAEFINEGFPRQMSATYTRALNDFQELDYFTDNSNQSIDYTLNIELPHVEQYLIDLITNNHPELAVSILTENPEQAKSMPPRSILAIYNTTNRSGLNLLAFVAKNSPEEFAKIARLLSKQNLLTCMSAKNKLGDTVLHSILSKPQALQLVVAALPGDTLAALSQLKNSRGETLSNAATNSTSRQILLGGLINPNDLITEGPIVANEELEVRENIPTTTVKSESISVDTNTLQASPSETDSEESPSTISEERIFSPSVQTNLTFFRAKTPQENDEILHQLYLNNDPNDLIASGARDCFVWQTTKRRELVYIAADGTASIAQMPINKAFTFQAELQKVAKGSGESQESNCILQVTTDEMQGLLEKAAINSQIFSETLIKTGNDTDSETASDDSVAP